METLLGLIIMYVWVHSVVILVKKTKELTTYELTVLLIGLAGVILYIMGTM